MQDMNEVLRMENIEQRKMKKIERLAFDQLKKLNETEEKFEYDLIKVLKMMNKGG